jgi:hypothetical protein
LSGVRSVFNGFEVKPPEDDRPETIRVTVRVVLEKDPLVNTGPMSVGVRYTLVRLTGRMTRETERQAAERDVWMAFGGDTVFKQIHVQP